MSQNPEETPDQYAGQGRSGGVPKDDKPTSSSPYDSGQSPYGASGTSSSGSSGPFSGDDSDSSTSPYGSQDSGPSTSPYSPPPGPYDSPQPGYDQSAGQPGGQSGYPQYGQHADPDYGQGQYPPAQSEPHAQQGPGGYDPNAQYGAQGYPPQQYSQPGYPQYAGQAPVSESDEKLWALLAHISIPFIGFIGPLIVYLIYKDRSPWLKDASTEALNFSILYSIATLVSSMLTAVLIGLILLPLLFVGALIFCILAALAANRHELYRYPINWRIIK